MIECFDFRFLGFLELLRIAVAFLGRRAVTFGIDIAR